MGPMLKATCACIPRKAFTVRWIRLPKIPGNIHAKDLIAYGGTKDIGTKDNPVTVNLTGDLLAANADRNVYIKNQIADSLLRLGSVYAGDTVHLESEQGFAMTKNDAYKMGYLNAGRQLDLITNTTTGVIGAHQSYRQRCVCGGRQRYTR